MSILKSYYISLTGNLNCKVYGAHWYEVGFQSTDPTSDFRGFGMLGPLMMLAFATEQHEILITILQFVVGDNTKFPLSATLINMTKMAVEALRQRKLNRVIIRMKSVVAALNLFYFALTYKLFYIYKSENKTVRDHGFIMLELEMQANDSPESLIKEY